MTSRRGLGATQVAIGVLLVLLAALADTIGIGGEPHFGWKQGIALGVGLALTLFGAAMLAGLIEPTNGNRDS